MAFRYEKTDVSEIGKKTIKSIAGLDSVGIDFDNFSLKDRILAKYGSVKNLEKKAKLSGHDWQAQAHLASIYNDGLPELKIKKDLDTAIYWFEKSIENGNNLPGHISLLGALHDSKGTVPHQRRAHKLYMKAAQLGDKEAEINLAESYRCGVEGVVQEDIEEAFKWYRKAAGEETREDDQGDSPVLEFLTGGLRKVNVDSKFKALKMLYQNYSDGDCPEGEPQPIKALYYLKKAAELGDPKAQKDLGLAYLTGESGHPKDLHKAKRWLGKAAKNGEEEAKQVLKKLNDQNFVVDTTQPETCQPDSINSIVQQYLDIKKMQKKQEELHPFIIRNPTVFKESTFTQFPDSPTAQHYLKAFRLVEKGLSILQNSKFPDTAKGIKLIAQGILYENSIIQSFPAMTVHKLNFLPSFFDLIYEHFKVDANFLEGLILLVVLYPTHQKLSLDSYKLDFKKTMSLNNLIQLIKKAEPDKPPKQDPYNFEEDYSSWLHVLYYYLGSHYIVTGLLKDGAEAFQQSLHCCPSYYEAKMFLAYCLMDMSVKEHEPLNPDEELLESFEPPKNQRVPKGDYLTWTKDQLRKKAKRLFMEYLQEAPECDKKYPHCHYHLAVLHLIEGDLQEAIKWKEKGEDAEEKRLLFMEPVNVGSKKLLEMLDMLPNIPKIIKKKCSNKMCPHKETETLTLKPCPCHTASYCGSKCQAADWKEHKKTCSHRLKNKSSK